MAIYAGHCNGTQYLVKEIGDYRLILHKLDAKEDDKTKILVLSWLPCHYGGRNFPFELTRLRFPLKIAFALTINRAQGQSAQKVAFCSQRMFGPMGKHMLFFPGVGILTTFLYGQSSHISKISREDWSLERNISRI